MLIEARLSWGGDVHTVAHVRARGLVQLSAFELPSFDEAVVVFDGVRLVCERLSCDDLVVSFALTEEAPKLGFALGEFRTTKGVALAAVLHVTFLTMAFVGRASVHEEEVKNFATLKALAGAIDERDAVALESHDEPMPSKPGATGAAGTPVVEKKEGLRAAKPRAVDPVAERAAVIRDAREFGMITLLASADIRAHADPFGSYEGPPAVGSIFGTKVDDALGFGGAGLSGTGLGGGGKGDGVGLDGVGTSFGACGCDASASTTGHGSFGRLSGGHTTKAPVLRCGEDPVTKQATCAMQVNGRLPPEIVQRIVRQSFGRLRMCYEQGLQRNPSLEGRVAVKFVIDRSGAVAMASTSDRTFADSDVASCVERAFRSMSFPEPEGGIVTVVYPLVLST